jgi:hypothetical protein
VGRRFFFEQLAQPAQLIEIAFDGFSQISSGSGILGELPLAVAIVQVLQYFFHPEQLGMAIHGNCLPAAYRLKAGQAAEASVHDDG